MFSIRSALLVNFLSCGLEFLACAGFTYIPPLLRKSGHSEVTMALTMGLGPLLGFIFVPYIGEASDNLRFRYGRRKPFIFVLSCVAALSFILMPYVQTFLPTPNVVSKKDSSLAQESHSIFTILNPQSMAFLVTLLVILFDFSSQVAFTPFEALLADIGKPLGSHGTEKLFQIYSFMVGVGGICGYLITSLDWKSIGQFLSNFGANTQEERVFLVVFAVFLLSVCISMKTAKDSAISGKRVRLDSKSQIQTIITDALCTGEKSSKSSPCCQSTGRRFLLCICPASFLRLVRLPQCLKRLCAFQFFTWTGLMSYGLFFTDFVGEAVYNGDPSPEATIIKNDLYDEGVRVGSLGLLVHCVSCSGFPILHELFFKQLPKQKLLFFTLLASTISILIMTLFPSAPVMVVMSIFPGFLMGAMMSVPFGLLTLYHDNESVYLADCAEVRGVGTDVAILDSMYFLAEFALSVFDSLFVMIIGSTYAYMYAAVVFGVIATLLIFSVAFDESSAMKYNSSSSSYSKAFFSSLSHINNDASSSVSLSKNNHLLSEV